MRLLIYCISLICFINSGALTVSYAEEPKDTVSLYIQALRDGDTEEMITYLGGRLYSKRKVLLEQNASYPEFLSNLYQGTVIHISEPINTNFDPLQFEVGVEFQYPNGGSMWVKLSLAQNSLGDWKIVDENDIAR